MGSCVYRVAAALGITNTVGRIAVGFVADLENVSPLLLHNLALLLAGTVCFLNMFFVVYPLMVIYSLLIGIGMGQYDSYISSRHNAFHQN